MPALGGAVDAADPAHLQLELLVLVVLLGDVDDPRGLLDGLLEVELAVGEVELLELGLGGLAALAGGGAVVAPVHAAGLDHVEAGAAVEPALDLAAGADGGAEADLAVDGGLELRVEAAEDGGDAEGADGLVEGVGLQVAAHAAGEVRGGDGRLEGLAPGAGLVAGAVDEVVAVGDHAGVDLDTGAGEPTMVSSEQDKVSRLGRGGVAGLGLFLLLLLCHSAPLRLLCMYVCMWMYVGRQYHSR